MGLQGLSLRRVAAIERHTRLTVLRAVVNNGGGGGPVGRRWHFITDDHRHGWYEPGGSHAFYVGLPGDDGEGHLQPMCGWLFGDPPRARDGTWGHVCADGVWRVWQEGTRRPRTWPAAECGDGTPP